MTTTMIICAVITASCSLAMVAMLAYYKHLKNK